MTTLHHVKKARKAIKGTDIKKGDSYYWWQFAFRARQVSKTMPRRSQYMTQSEHLGSIYDLEDQLSALTIEDISESCIDDIKSEIENIRDTCEERLNNMPEQLQEAPAGQTLQEYIDNCESWLDDLEGVDFDNIEEDAFVEDATEEWNNLTEEEKKDQNQVDWIANRAAELLEERKQEILDDIQSKNYPG